LPSTCTNNAHRSRVDAELAHEKWKDMKAKTMSVLKSCKLLLVHSGNKMKS
jgi:hypothetical protein